MNRHRMIENCVCLSPCRKSLVSMISAPQERDLDWTATGSRSAFYIYVYIYLLILFSFLVVLIVSALLLDSLLTSDRVDLTAPLRHPNGLRPRLQPARHHISSPNNKFTPSTTAYRDLKVSQSLPPRFPSNSNHNNKHHRANAPLPPFPDHPP
jgi:hypothetical protein